MFTLKPIYLLLIVPALLGWFAQWRLKQVFDYYLDIPNKKGINGIEAARELLSFYKIDISILPTAKQMLNYYNPQDKTLHIYRNIAESSSLASLGIVAHEVEHAVQDWEGFRFMNLRNRIAKTLAVIGQLSPLVFIWGVFFRNILLIYTGVLLLFGMVIFALISLPVELNASHRALNVLQATGLADEVEIKMVGVVLRHAALTYFVSAIQRIGTFLFIILILTMVNNK